TMKRGLNRQRNSVPQPLRLGAPTTLFHQEEQELVRRLSSIESTFQCLTNSIIVTEALDIVLRRDCNINDRVKALCRVGGKVHFQIPIYNYYDLYINNILNAWRIDLYKIQYI